MVACCFGNVDGDVLGSRPLVLLLGFLMHSLERDAFVMHFLQVFKSFCDKRQAVNEISKVSSLFTFFLRFRMEPD